MIPKSLSFLLVVVVVNLGCSAPAPEAETAAVEADTPEFVDLFNGRDLDGWVIESDGQFLVRDGLLFNNRGTGWLRSLQEYGDFVLEIEYRHLEEGGESGIFIRTAATKREDETGWPNNGYQIALPEALEEEYPPGTLIPYGAPPYQDSSDLEALARAYRPAGEWNAFEITCMGEELSITFNGEVITTATDIMRPTGHVGIQGEGGLLEFRAIRIRVFS